MSNVVKYILDLQTDKAAKGLQGLSASLKKAGPILGALKNDMRSFGKAVVDVSRDFYKLTKGAVDAVNRLNDLSTASNLAATTINAVEFAFAASGQSMEAADTVLKKFPHRMKEIRAEGTTANKMMEILGISTKNLDGTMRSSDEVFKDLIKNLQNMEDAELKTQVATELFRRDAGNLMVALGNSAPLEKFTAFTEKFGVNAKKSADMAAAFQRSVAGLSVVTAFLRDKFVDATGGMSIFNKIIIEGVGAVVFIGKMMSLFATEIRLTGNAIAQMVISQIRPLIMALVLLGKLVPKVGEDIGTILKMTGMQKAGGAFTNIQSRIDLAKESANEAKKAMSGLVTEIDSTGNTSEEAAKKLKALIEKAKEADQEGKKAKKDGGIGKIIFGDKKDFIKDFAKFDKLQTQAQKGFSDFTKEFRKGGIEIDSALESADQFIDLFKEMSLPTDEITKFVNNLRSLKREQGQLAAMESNINLGLDLTAAFASGGFGDLIGKSLESAIEKSDSKTLGIIGKLFEPLVNLGEKSPKEIREEGEAFNTAITNGIMMLPTILLEVLPHLFIDLAGKLLMALSRLPMEFFISFTQAMGKLAQAFADIVTAPFDELVSIMKEIWEWITAPFSIFDSKMGGGRFRVPHGEGGLRYTGAKRGLAMLHEGEVVVPRSGQASQGIQRRFGGGSGMNIVINSAVVDGNVVETLVQQIEQRFEAFGSSTSTLFSS